MWLSSWLSSHGLHLQPIPRSLLQIPPSSTPGSISPSDAHASQPSWLIIPESLYQAVLHPSVPITIALTYASTAILLNRYNARRANKPWPVSQTRAFYWAVLAHNGFLALYSAWTFVGMFRALQQSLPTFGSDLVQFADAFCKIHGPRGLGNAVSYSQQRAGWQVSNGSIQLDDRGSPRATDLGRIWNEGLAYYGWLFYLSKFYEVLDTLIILVKGKRSSTLQTYHHAGAMIGMWAGIRYMAPPIWMFAFLNSGIHAMMYTYYTLTAMGFKVPNRIKRTLTTLQILQFIVGMAFASLHLFVVYEVPLLPSLSGTSRLAMPPNESHSLFTTTSVGIIPLIKKVFLRAGGFEGAAATVGNERAQSLEVSSANNEQGVKFRTASLASGTHAVQCLDTSGEAFAVLFNCFYLAPLTILFVRFFIKSYIRKLGGKAGSFSKSHVRNAGMDATKGMTRRIMGDIGSMHGTEDGTSTFSTVVREK